MTKSVEKTPRAEHALLAMRLLAARDTGKPTPLSDIAAEQGISLSYLEQIFQGLRQAKIVKSYRGPGGGYVLNKDANAITVADIVVATYENPRRDGSVLTDDFWNYFGTITHGMLDKFSLSDVVQGKFKQVAA